jgi:hypothetical protein
MANMNEKEQDQATAMNMIRPLLGKWFGSGVAAFPTIATFEYREELEFTANDTQPVLRYEQRTWKKLETGEYVPSHWEVGFWRILSANELEISCAQLGGRVEVLRGDIEPTREGFVFKPRSQLVANDARMDATAREFVLQGDWLRYAMAMSTTAVPALTPHVHAELKRG